jgi:tetratricopeptide (TPR) repeat protein
MKTVLPMLALSALLCGLPASAHAEDADDAEVTRMAKEHYKAGLDAYKTGKFDVAIKELKKAYLLKRLPALLLNIGATYRKMGDYDLALHFYQKYLEEAPAEARDRGEVQKTIAEINVEKSGGGAAAEAEKQAVKHEDDAPPPPKPAALPQEWQHAVIDAAPPETPLDVRVSMPVMKGVKVYVYYRGAGEESFKPVLMKRRGNEKVGRIPAEAVQGKAIQYYVEARDPAGTVVKNSGSQSNPNIVMVDPSAPPQMLASLDERRERQAEPQPEPGDEQPRKKSTRNLDDESAPMGGNLDDENPEKRMKKETRPKSAGAGLSPMFTAGIIVGSIGIGALAGGIALGTVAQSKANSVSGDSQSGLDADGNKFFFNNDPNTTGSQAYQIEAQGKAYDAAGIALDVIGGVALAAGAVLMMVDKLASPASEKPKKRHRPRPRPSEEEAKSNPWYIAPAASHNFAGVGAGFSF